VEHKVGTVGKNSRELFCVFCEKIERTGPQEGQKKEQRKRGASLTKEMEERGAKQERERQ
jgi:hypothetical protein